MLATLLLSQGTPMLLAGDEFSRSQQGNNNAYCQDNELNWIDWQGIDGEGKALVDFVRQLIALRQSFPVLRRTRFFMGNYDETFQGKDVTWLSPSGEEMTPELWGDGNARSIAIVFDGRAPTTGVRKAATDATLLLVLNAYHDVVTCKLPPVAGGETWQLLVDTNLDHQTALPPFPFGHQYMVTGRSFLLFALSGRDGQDRAVLTAQKILARLAEEPIMLTGTSD
jgi:glycogen operon protein